MKITKYLSYALSYALKFLLSWNFIILIHFGFAAYYAYVGEILFSWAGFHFGLLILIYIECRKFNQPLKSRRD